MMTDNHRRRADLEQLRRILPPSPAWEQWLEASGELPPDFEALPASYDLPDPLAGLTDPAQWPARRSELLDLFTHWLFGTAPPPPDDLSAEVLSERDERGGQSREVRLHFGGASLWCELLIPTGAGPFPVFMTQHNHRNWGQIAASRGYLACIYAGSDSRDDTDSFIAAYPGYDWSRLRRRAWAASRCLDYLEGVPEANTAQVGITGHSRNGKLSLIASAYDTRFAAVISSSSGAGGSLATRFFSEQHFAEGIEFITRRFPDWFHPRWRFFTGREHRLPVDLHTLLAMGAPRPCLLATAINDHVEGTWALEQTFRGAQPVYQLLDADEKLRISYRPGSHEHDPTTIHAFLDWFDRHFGRGDTPFPDVFFHPIGAFASTIAPTFSPRITEPPADRVAWDERLDGLRRDLDLLLGAEPPGFANAGDSPTRDAPHREVLLMRLPEAADVIAMPVAFGEHLQGNVYLPREVNGALPGVLWLAPGNTSKGYPAGYRRGPQVFETLARAGFAVFCFDPVGTGSRIGEVTGFYRRYPNWSLLGKMLRDASAALDAFVKLPVVDPARIYGLGYAQGAFAGLHLLPFEPRLAGFAAVSAPAPFRHDPDYRRWAGREALLPALGAPEPDALPYDVDDLLASAAPRPLLVVSPLLDWQAPPEAVAEAVNFARAIYDLHGAADALTHLTPEAYNHFDDRMQAHVVEWLREMAR